MEWLCRFDQGRIERRRRELALDVAAGRMNERAFLAAMRRLNDEQADHTRPLDAVYALPLLEVWEGPSLIRPSFRRSVTAAGSLAVLVGVLAG